VEEELFLEGGGGDYILEGAVYEREACEEVSEGEEMADSFEELGGWQDFMGKSEWSTVSGEGAFGITCAAELQDGIEVSDNDELTLDLSYMCYLQIAMKETLRVERHVNTAMEQHLPHCHMANAHV
jgi:hypothetical protein